MQPWVPWVWSATPPPPFRSLLPTALTPSALDPSRPPPRIKSITRVLSHGVGSRTRLVQTWNLVTSDLSFPVCASTHLRSIPFSWLCGPWSSRYRKAYACSHSPFALSKRCWPCPQMQPASDPSRPLQATIISTEQPPPLAAPTARPWGGR